MSNPYEYDPRAVGKASPRRTDRSSSDQWTDIRTVVPAPPRSWPLSWELIYGLDWSAPADPSLVEPHEHELLVLLEVLDPHVEAPFDGALSPVSGTGRRGPRTSTS
jgi:hypothetical protein